MKPDQTTWWLTQTESGRRALARMVPPRIFEQMTGRKHPSTLAYEDQERRRRERDGKESHE